MEPQTSNDKLRRVVLLVMALNLGYFGVEFAVALAIGSVSLFADSIDFLEDASVNFLIFMALGWSAVLRARVGMLLAGILLIPGLATLWTAWAKFNVPVAPDPIPLSLAEAADHRIDAGATVDEIISLHAVEQIIAARAVNGVVATVGRSIIIFLISSFGSVGKGVPSFGSCCIHVAWIRGASKKIVGNQW